MMRVNVVAVGMTAAAAAAAFAVAAAGFALALVDACFGVAAAVGRCVFGRLGDGVDFLRAMRLLRRHMMRGRRTPYKFVRSRQPLACVPSNASSIIFETRWDRGSGCVLYFREGEGDP